MMFFTPTRIAICPDLNNIFEKISANKFLILSTNSAAERSGGLRDVVTALGMVGKSFIFENSIRPNPTVQSIDTLYNEYRHEGIEAIVSIGGGSAIDAGKALNLCFSNDISCSSLLKSDYSRFSKIVHMALPTTCGTGSETSKGAILSDYENEWKGGIRGENVFCDFAILDPKYLSSLPLDTCLTTGFDAVSHAVETYISNRSSVISRQLSIAALRLIVPVLRALVKRGSVSSLTYKEKSQLQMGSTLSGICLANSTTCLPHRLQYAIGSTQDIRHADGVALFFVPWLIELQDKDNHRLKELDSIVSQMQSNSSPRASIIKLIEDIGMARSRSDLKIENISVEDIIKRTIGDLSADPAYEGDVTIQNIVGRIM